MMSRIKAAAAAASIGIAMIAECTLARGALGAVAATRPAAEADADNAMTAEEAAELLANPFSNLWFGMIQNDTYWWDGDLNDALGEGSKVMNTTVVQPVMSLQWSKDWRLIFRPVIPIHSFDTLQGFDIIEDEPDAPTLSGDFQRRTGLGDIVLWSAFSPQYKPPLVYGFGPTIMMNTASSDELGTGKWSAGPMATIAHISDKWILGAVAQHWWSFAGDADRDAVNLTDFQPIIRYRINQKTNIGMAPNIQYNWSAASGERLRLPVGLGISTVAMFGKLPVGIGVEAYYFVESPDTFGPEWGLRVFFTPVLPAPDWSKVPLFGG